MTVKTHQNYWACSEVSDIYYAHRKTTNLQHRVQYTIVVYIYICGKFLKMVNELRFFFNKYLHSFDEKIERKT